MTISFFPQVIRGAETAARQQGYSLMAVNSDEDGERQKELLSLLRSQRVEGILLVLAAVPTPLSQLARILDASIPMVCLDRIPDRVPVDSVSVEDEEAAEMGVAHLIEMGARRIAVATGPSTLKNERRRLQGYRQALEKAGIPLDDSLIWQGNLGTGDVTEVCRKGFAATLLRPQAIFCTNGPTALGVLRALRSQGMEIPRDIAFATFDELTVDGLFSPSITTVVQPAYDIGFNAAQLLLDRIEGRAEGKTPISVRLPASLKVRESSKIHRE